MIGFLPERIYNLVKNDTEYLKLESDIKEKIIKDDLVEYIIAYELCKKENPYIQNSYDDIVKRLIQDPAMVRELTILETVDENTLLTLLTNETDIENKLLFYIQILGVLYTSFTDSQRIKYINDYINLFEAEKDNNHFSEKLYIEYFNYKCFLLKQTIQDKNFQFEENTFSQFIENVDALINEIMNYFPNNNAYIKNYLYHYKIFNIFDYLANIYEYVGISEIFLNIIEFNLPKILANNEFKYSNFNFYTMQLYDLIVKVYFDCRDEKALVYLSKIITMINDSVKPENRRSTIKALNFYNKVLNFSYLNFIMKYKALLDFYLPNFPLKLDINLFSSKELEIINRFSSASDSIYGQ